MTAEEFVALGRCGGVVVRVVGDGEERYSVLGFAPDDGGEEALWCVALSGDARRRRLRFDAATRAANLWAVDEVFDAPSVFSVKGAVFPDA